MDCHHLALVFGCRLPYFGAYGCDVGTDFLSSGPGSSRRGSCHRIPVRCRGLHRFCRFGLRDLGIAVATYSSVRDPASSVIATQIPAAVRFYAATSSSLFSVDRVLTLRYQLVFCAWCTSVSFELTWSSGHGGVFRCTCTCLIYMMSMLPFVCVTAAYCGSRKISSTQTFAHGSWERVFLAALNQIHISNGNEPGWSISAAGAEAGRWRRNNGSNGQG